MNVFKITKAQMFNDAKGTFLRVFYSRKTCNEPKIASPRKERRAVVDVTKPLPLWGNVGGTTGIRYPYELRSVRI